MIAIHSHPTKQPNTNLIKYGVATAVTPTHNTTNNSKNHLLINLYSMSRTMQHLKFLHLSSCFIVHNYPFFLSKQFISK